MERGTRERASAVNARRAEASERLATVRQQLAATGSQHGPARADLRRMERRYAEQLAEWEQRKATIAAERERSLELALNAMSIIVDYGQPGEHAKAFLTPLGGGGGGGDGGAAPARGLRAAQPVEAAAPASPAPSGRAIPVAPDGPGGLTVVKLSSSGPGQRNWAVPVISEAEAGAAGRAAAPGGGAPRVSPRPALSSEDMLGAWHSPVEELPTPGRKQTLAPMRPTGGAHTASSPRAKHAGAAGARGAPSPERARAPAAPPLAVGFKGPSLQPRLGAAESSASPSAARERRVAQAQGVAPAPSAAQGSSSAAAPRARPSGGGASAAPLPERSLAGQAAKAQLALAHTTRMPRKPAPAAASSGGADNGGGTNGG